MSSSPGIEGEREAEEPCQYCGHPFSMHFSDDVRGLGSKDASSVHKGCSYQSPSDGSICQCPGFRSVPGTTTTTKNSAGVL
ncbi:hypothetical protein [Candidatus Nitrososphaera evergladensis]|uniref:hypothetical protein n=1 Tax=Candidatus Nitrososphaera evergladensis TaxID=1459637 RepID=UPI0011E5F1BB|nr:hypothetical protein [Candidatus Nitrososphaera evergladensis]